MLKASHVNGGGTVMLSSIIATGGFMSVFILFYGILSLFDDADHHSGSVTKSLGFRLPGAKHRGYSHTILFNLILGYGVYSIFKYFYADISQTDLYILLLISLSHLLYDFFTQKKIPAFAPSAFFVIPLLIYVFYYKINNGGIDINNWKMFDLYVISGLAVLAFIIEKFVLTKSLKGISEFVNQDIGIPIFSTGKPMEKIFAFLNSFINLGLLAYIIWKYIIPQKFIMPHYDTKIIFIALGFNIFISYLLFKDEIKYFSKNVNDTIRSIFKIIFSITLNVIIIGALIFINQKFNLINFNDLAKSINIGFINSGEVLMYILFALGMLPSISLVFKNFEEYGFKIAAASNVVIMFSTFLFFLLSLFNK